MSIYTLAPIDRLKFRLAPEEMEAIASLEALQKHFLRARYTPDCHMK